MRKKKKVDDPVVALLCFAMAPIQIPITKSIYDKYFKEVKHETTIDTGDSFSAWLLGCMPAPRQLPLERE